MIDEGHLRADLDEDLHQNVDYEVGRVTLVLLIVDIVIIGPVDP